MKIKEFYSLKCIDGQNIIVSNNKTQKLNTSIVLSEISSYLFDLLKENDLNEEEMLYKLLENFEVSSVLALRDINVFVKELKRFDILE